ncbi:hypothetical protein [Nocardia sp. MW-W600-9]
MEYTLAAPGAQVRPATDNNSYLGHVMVTDAAPGGAGELARKLIGDLRFELAAPGGAA